jgi:hypothetical protein
MITFLILLKLMENSWRNSRESKLATDSVDREMIQYNPINWSHTLN